MTFRPSKQPMHPEIMLPSLFLCHGGATEKKERKKRTKKWGGRKMKNQPSVRSVADSDKSFRTHRAGYFIGQGSIDTALTRGHGEHRHRKRWGQNSRTHCMGLGATTIFRSASLLFATFLSSNTMEYVFDTRSVEYADNIRQYWRAHWGGDIYYTFFRVSGEIH